LRAARPQSKLEIVGVEVSESAGQIATQVLDRLVVGNAEQVELEYENYFDCVIFADVLEHLIDPWRMLRRARRFLRGDGTIVASIPNVQHWSVLAGLIGGRYLGRWAKKNWSGEVDEILLIELLRAGSLPKARIRGIVAGLGEVMRIPESCRTLSIAMRPRGP